MIPERIQVAERIGRIGEAEVWINGGVKGGGRSVVCNVGVGVRATCPEHGHRVPIEVAVLLIPMELRDAKGEWRGTVPHGRAAARLRVEPELDAARITRAIPDLIHRLGLRRRQTVWVNRGAAIGAADRGRVVRGAVGTSARVVNDAVGDAVKCIAGRSSLAGREVLFGRGDDTAGQILHDDLSPHLRRLKPRPVDRRRVGQDAIELIAELLREQVALTAAGRAAIPIVIQRWPAVIGFSEGFREKDLLLEAVAAPVLDVLHVVCAIQIHSGFAVVSCARMAAVGARSDVARVHGRIDVGISCAAAAAQTLGAAIPGALDPTGPAIGPAQRQAHNDRDVLAWVSTVDERHPAIRGAGRRRRRRFGARY